ncbi:upstream stimulatory factor 2 isoform X2 [Siphateles boraxobius]|uniref:upstream stimulatory factor 2 isoform X2 n=1 Tax=Siphateles boraxobius TaxID=180520 RepID=UPI004062ED21
MICERVRALMDQLQLNTHSSHRNKFICSHKNQDKKVGQITEGLAVAADPRPLAHVDGNIHYQFHTEHPGGQTVIQNSFSNGGSPDGDGDREETRCVYFPASSVSEGTAAEPTITHTTGHLYVMMTPSDALLSASQRTIAPHTHTCTVKMDSPRTPRDERRRAQHNEDTEERISSGIMYSRSACRFERRRRDKINNWIVTLSKMIPDCGIDSAKTAASKGGILSKACDYISELKQHKQSLQESLRRAERVQVDNELLRQKLEELKSENGRLRAQLEHHGIDTFTQ